MDKPVFVINGFLDSGKTSFIRDTLSDPKFLASGKLLLILAEEGEEEYDEIALSKKGVSIISVEEQEQLTTKFLCDLEDFYDPDMIMIEWNGMWKLTDLLELDLALAVHEGGGDAVAHAEGYAVLDVEGGVGAVAEESHLLAVADDEVGGYADIDVTVGADVLLVGARRYCL